MKHFVLITLIVVLVVMVLMNAVPTKGALGQVTAWWSNAIGSLTKGPPKQKKK